MWRQNQSQSEVGGGGRFVPRRHASLIENVGISCAILRIHGDVPFEFVRWSGQVPLYPMLIFRGVTKDSRQLLKMVDTKIST